MPKDFTELKIWQEGYALLLEIYRLAANFPGEERFGLRPQIQRAANSVIANIAESWGRYYFLERVRALSVSQGEVEETRSHLRVAHGLGYISDPEFLAIDSRYLGLARGIMSYSKSLRNQHKLRSK